MYRSTSAGREPIGDPSNISGGRAEVNCPATVSYTLTPNPNGTLSGERTAAVDGPGCGTPRVPAVFVSPVTGAPA